MSPILNVTDLPERETYASASEDLCQAVRSTLTVHRKVGNGIEDEPVAIADMLRLQSLNLADEERTQVVLNTVDSGKLFIYGRQPRVYTASGFLVDSRRDRALRRWLLIYNDYARLSACFRNGYIVRLRWRTTELFGFLLSNVVSMESQNKVLWIVSYTFIHISGSEDVDVPQVQIDNNTFPAFLGASGGKRLILDRAFLQTDIPEALDSPILTHIDSRTRAAPI